MKNSTITILASLIGLLTLPLIANAGNWEFSKRIDDFDDTVTYSASSGPVNEYASVLCLKSGKLSVAFRVYGFREHGSWANVRFRIDKNETQEGKWLVTRENIVIVNGTDTIDLAREMRAGRAMLLEVTNSSGVSHKARYSLAGSSAAIGKVMDKCAVDKAEIRK